MKKSKILKISTILSALLLCTSTTIFAQDTSQRVVKVQIGSTQATIDNENSEMEVAPYISNGNTMIPLRFVANALNISDENIIYENDTKYVHIIKDSTTSFTFQIGSDKLLINKDNDLSIKTMDNYATTELTDSRTFVPFRELANCFDLEIDWDNDTKTVTLTDNNISNASQLPSTMVYTFDLGDLTTKITSDLKENYMLTLSAEFILKNNIATASTTEQQTQNQNIVNEASQMVSTAISKASQDALNSATEKMKTTFSSSDIAEAMNNSVEKSLTESINAYLESK